MIEFRCKKCGKLLGYLEGKAEIKCTRCKTMNQINTKQEQQKIADRQ